MEWRRIDPLLTPVSQRYTNIIHVTVHIYMLPAPLIPPSLLSILIPPCIYKCANCEIQLYVHTYYVVSRVLREIQLLLLYIQQKTRYCSEQMACRSVQIVGRLVYTVVHIYIMSAVSRVLREIPTSEKVFLNSIAAVWTNLDCYCNVCVCVCSQSQHNTHITDTTPDDLCVCVCVCSNC